MSNNNNNQNNNPNSVPLSPGPGSGNDNNPFTKSMNDYKRKLLAFRATFIPEESRISGKYFRLVYSIKFGNKEGFQKVIFDVPAEDMIDFSFIANGGDHSTLGISFKNAWVHIENSPFHERKENVKPQ